MSRPPHGFRELVRLAQAVTSSLSLSDVLDRVAVAAIDLVPDSSARIWVLRDARLVLEAEAGSSGPPGAGRKTELAIGEGVAGDVARTHRPLVIDEVVTDPRTVNVDWMREQGFVSYIGLPLIVGERLVGVLSLHTRHRHRFADAELDLLMSFGSQAAIALDNARLFEDTMADREAAETLARVARTITESLDMSTVGQRIVESLLPLFGMQYAVLRLLQGDGSLMAIASAGPARDHFQLGHLHPHATGLVGRAVIENRPVWSRDVLSDPSWPSTDDLLARTRAAGIHAFLAVPIRAHGRTVGVLGIGDSAVRDFRERDIRLLEAFGDQAALALENARLYGELRDAHDFLSSIAHNSADAIVTTDVDGRVTFFSTGAEEMLGFRADEMLGRSMMELSPGREARHFVAALRRAGSIRDHEMTFCTRDGRRIDVTASVSLLRDPRGVTLGTVGVLRDITERKRAATALARQVEAITHLSREVEARETFIRNVVESLAEGLVVLDSGGAIVTWNRAMETLCGIAAAEVIGQPWTIPFASLGDKLREPLARMLAGDLAEFTLDGVECRSRDERRVVLNVKGSLLLSDRTPSGAALLVEDITERVSLAHAARQAEKMAALGTLCAGVAHEVNNPIGIVTSRIELMLMEADQHRLPAEFRDDLLVLHRNAQRVARITQGLLSFARQSRDELAPLDLGLVVSETLLLMERQLAKDGVLVRRAIEPELPMILGDGSAFQQVIMNLLTNAREAMPRGGEIRIELGVTEDRPERVRLLVADTGTGIDPKDLPKIFDPFYTTKDTGTGLGLSITYGIVRHHRGTVDVQSSPGRGSTFVMTFPVVNLEARA